VHPRSTDRPSQHQLIFPLLETIRDLGGRATALDAADALAERFDLPQHVVDETTTTRDGQVVSLWRRHVRYAREKAKSMGYLGSDRRGGDWILTDHGHAGLAQAAPALVIEVITNDQGLPIAARINIAVGIPTTHALIHADARDLSFIRDGEIPLIVTSPPYADIKNYGNDAGQLAVLPSYEAFLDALDDVWRECFRVLTPGGRVAINTGDVLRARAKHGAHFVLPLHADILARSTRLGFHALNGILWRKMSNCAFEEGKSGGYLGKPGQPNSIIKSEIEHILLLRKPGPYRTPTLAQQRDSAITREEHARWFRPIWDDIRGARTTGAHPAPFPVSIPERLIRMFSFRGDHVLDVFGGSATTAIAAARAGRDSTIVDCEARFIAHGIERLQNSEREILAA
jgi:site-specific DNA-methyltransferase (adenine-specific)